MYNHCWKKKTKQEHENIRNIYFVFAFDFNALIKIASDVYVWTVDSRECFIMA